MVELLEAFFIVDGNHLRGVEGAESLLDPLSVAGVVANLLAECGIAHFETTLFEKLRGGVSKKSI